MPATLGRAVQRQAEVGQATGEESLAQAVLKGECWQHGPGGVGSAGCLVSDGSPGATSATGQAAGGHPPPRPRRQPYLLFLHAPQRLGDELDVLACERGQLTVAGSQVHVLGGREGGGTESAPPLPQAYRAECSPPALRPPPTRLTSWMTLSDPDWTLGFLAGEATGSSCALYVTSWSS